MIRRALVCALAGLMTGCGGGSASTSPAATATAAAARYLVSDPYPLTSTQPDHFDVACDATAPMVSAPAVNPDGTSYLHYDLSGLVPGSHTCSVAAANASNQQSAADTVSFTL